MKKEFDVHDFIIRIISCCIPVRKWRRRFRSKHLYNSRAKLDLLMQKIDYLTSFVQCITDITNIPRAHGNLRTIQQGSAKLLQTIDTICKKHKLKYWLHYGTLLGAVRHGGFIPWDDDIDIGMMRDDYEKLIEILGNGLYKKTTGNITFNVGDILKVFYKDTPARVDIFPFDQYYKEAKTQKEQEVLLQDLKKVRENYIHWDWKHLCDFWPDIIPTIELSYKDIRELSNKHVMKNKHPVKKGSIFRGIETQGASSGAKRLYKYDDIFPLGEITFENFTVYIPNKTKDILYMSYGDIYKFPQELSPHHALLYKSNCEQLKEIDDFLNTPIADIIKGKK